MIKMFIGSFLLCLGLMAIEAQARPDDDCDGRWSIELIKDRNYTARHAHLKTTVYPVKLRLDPHSIGRATFTDNHGRECYTGYLTDDDSDFVVIKHCGETSSDMVPTHYKLRCEGDALTGKIVSYKDLFNLKGIRVKQ